MTVSKFMKVSLLALSIPVASLISGGAQELPERVLTVKRGSYQAFIVETDGAVLLFPDDADNPPLRWKQGAWSRMSEFQSQGTVKETSQVEQGKWHMLSQLSRKQVILYSYDGSGITKEGGVQGRFHEPSLHTTQAGVTWISSGYGRAYRVTNGDITSHKFGPMVKNDDEPLPYSATRSINVDGRGTWFWSHVQHASERFCGRSPVMEGVHVYRGGSWKVVEHPAEKLGGVAIAKSGDLLCSTRDDSFFRLSSANGATKDINRDIPDGEHCSFLHRTPEGDVLAMTARPSKLMRLPPEKDGRIGSLVHLQEDGMETLIEGIDVKRADFDRGRAVVDCPQGTFIATAQAGLLFVRDDLSEVLRVDWRYGLPFPGVDRMQLQGRHLYLLDKERGLAVVDWQRMLDERHVAGVKNWEVRPAAVHPVLSSKGNIWYVSASSSPRLVCAKGEEPQTYPLEPSRVPLDSLWYLTADTEGRIWLISSHETHRTAFLDDGDWRTFKLRENAYSTVALEEKDNAAYQLGDPGDHCFPAFAGDGRVAYQNEWRRVCFFDGENWDYSYKQKKINRNLPEGPPFYADGNLTVKAGRHFYERSNDKWQRVDESVTSPYRKNPRKRRRPKLTDSFPGEEKSSIKVKDNSGTLWAGSLDRLYRGFADKWIPFNTYGTPLAMAESIQQVYVDGYGKTWFVLTGGDYPRLATYTPAAERPQLAWEKTPKERLANRRFTASLRSDTDAEKLFLAYRVDGKSWQYVPFNQVSTSPLENGKHTCEFRVFDSQLRSSPIISHKFLVNFDYAKEISKLVQQLGAETFGEREEAERTLRRMGPEALPHLKKYTDNPDPEISVRLQRVLEALKEKE